MSDDIQLYYLLRLGLTIYSVYAWGRILFRTIKRISGERDFDRRLWLGTVIYLLLWLNLLLLISAVYNLVNPPPRLPEPVPFAIGLAFSVSIAFGGYTLLKTWPRPAARGDE